MKKKIVVLLLLFSLVLTVFGCEKNKPSPSGGAGGKKYQGQSLLVHSGAGLKKAMDDAAKAFGEKTGAAVNMNYAGCAQLLGQMEINRKGDVFVGGSLNDMKIAKEKAFTDTYSEIAYHIPAIAVPKGNPANIKTLEDMAKPGVKLVLGDAKTNAIGKKGEKIFAKNNILDAINANVVARDATVNEIVTHIGMKQGDAGLVWADCGFNAKEIEIIEIPKEQNMIETVPTCKLVFAENGELAQAFVDYLCSAEGKAHFTNNGFEIK